MNFKVLFYLCLGLIVVLSIVPQNVNAAWLPEMTFTKSGFLQHVLGYFVLSVLAWHAFAKTKIWKILAGILILGVVLEIIQYALPTRTFNVYDLLANLAGVGVVALKTLFDTKRVSHRKY